MAKNTYQSSDIEVPADLFKKVMLRLAAEQRLSVIRQRFAWAVVLLVVVLVAAIPVWRSFQLDVSQSGFIQYLSLAYYDYQMVLAYWQDFSLTLLESIPIVSTVELLSVVFLIIAITRSLARYSKVLFFNSSQAMLINKA